MMYLLMVSNQDPKPHLSKQLVGNILHKSVYKGCS